MTFDLDALLEILENDRELLDEMTRAGLIEPTPPFDGERTDDARVARVLVRELEVNWPGVEIILRMRREIVELHRQMGELLTVLAARAAARR